MTARPGTLYLAATPIGNMEDVTLRFLSLVSDIGYVYCEDTRRTGRLLQRHGLKADLVSFQGYAEKGKTERAISELLAGRDIILVSDAGSPGISDPGSVLVRRCRQEGVPVSFLPGADAVTMALTLSGMAGGSFAFAGFPARKPAERKRFIRSYADFPGPVVYFESPRRLAGFLKDALDALGDRPAAVARELTKMHEEVVCQDLSHLVEKYADGAVKGEIVVVIGPAAESRPKPAGMDGERLGRMVTFLRKSGLPPAKAAKLLSELTGLDRSDAYERMTDKR